MTDPSHLLPEVLQPALHGTVLSIEDDPLVVAVLQAMLKRHPDVHLINAATGRDGIALARSEHPQFVLLDMHLPDMSGLAVVRELSEDIASRSLRVTILSADKLSIDIIKAMSLGAFEFWQKPLDTAVFEEGLRRALGGASADPAHTLRRRRR